jgi:hypothetical protein
MYICVANNGCFFGQSAFSSLLLLCAFFKFATFGCVFQKLHYFTQHKLHELYHTTGAAANDSVTVVYQIMGASFGQSAFSKFATFGCIFQVCYFWVRFSKIALFQPATVT